MRRMTFGKMPDGIATMPWPEREPSRLGNKPSRKHCPGCAECNNKRCYIPGGEHVECARHAGTQSTVSVAKPK